MDANHLLMDSLQVQRTGSEAQRFDSWSFANVLRNNQLLPHQIQYLSLLGLGIVFGALIQSGLSKSRLYQREGRER